MQSKEPVISARNVSKRFGAQVVLNDVSLDILPGKTTAIVGPSGVGKSVLLKLIMGILQPEEGDILIHGRSITQAPNERARNEIRECLGVLFQSAALYDSLSVYDNIAFPLRERAEDLQERKLSRVEIHEKVVEMLEALSLEEFAWNYPEEISIGIRKRVGLARALITRPEIVLFDEPNTGLDPLVGQEVYDLINLSKERWGVTGIVISHELPEVFQVSDRIVMLLGGKVVEDSTPNEFARSEKAVVQQFLHGKIDGPIKIQ